MLLFELSAGMSAADAAVQKKIYRSRTTALITSNDKNGRYNKNISIDWRIRITSENSLEIKIL